MPLKKYAPLLLIVKYYMNINYLSNGNLVTNFSFLHKSRKAWERESNGRMYSLGEVNFIQGMHDFGNPKNSVGLKPNAELRKDAKAPSIPKS